MDYTLVTFSSIRPHSIVIGHQTPIAGHPYSQNVAFLTHVHRRREQFPLIALHTGCTQTNQKTW